MASSDIMLRNAAQVANLPKRPACPICAGGGYIANGPLPKPLSAAALCANVIPCECPAGAVIRDLQAEMAFPVPQLRHA
jgi:hypothetical protein